MLDSKLLAAVIASRQAYDQCSAYITEKDLTPPVQFWWGQVREWYERDPQAKAVDTALLIETGRIRIKNPKHSETLLGAITNLPNVDSVSNVVATVLELKRHNAGLELAAAIAGQDSAKVAVLLPLYNDLYAATSLRERSTRELARDWVGLDEIIGSSNRIFVAPRKLNDKLSGGALPGHHIILFGRPEIGKSTVSINMSAGFLHFGQKVLYIGNEDNINVLKGRMRNRLADMTPAEVEKDPARANRLAEEKAGDRLRMVHMHRGGPADIEREVEDFEPTVLVIDQFRNLEAKGDGLTQKMEKNAIEVRRILSTYGLVGVSITQAYAGEHNRGPKVWLDMDDIESSRTGLPAQGDLIVGISGSDDMIQRNQRTLSLPKNKLSSEPGAHEGVVVEIDKARAKII